MAHDTSPERCSAPGSIDFEITDFADARQALDELPSGVARLVSAAPGYWERHRSKPRAQDRALAGATIDWLLALPPARRPHALCKQFPRVANAIAAAWPQPAERVGVLAGLLGDTRGQRRGFPAAVRHEIEALRGLPASGEDWPDTV